MSGKGIGRSRERDRQMARMKAGAKAFFSEGGPGGIAAEALREEPTGPLRARLAAYKAQNARARARTFGAAATLPPPPPLPARKPTRFE